MASLLSAMEATGGGFLEDSHRAGYAETAHAQGGPASRRTWPGYEAQERPRSVPTVPIVRQNVVAAFGATRPSRGTSLRASRRRTGSKATGGRRYCLCALPPSSPQGAGYGPGWNRGRGPGLASFLPRGRRHQRDPPDPVAPGRPWKLLWQPFRGDHPQGLPSPRPSRPHLGTIVVSHKKRSQDTRELPGRQPPSDGEASRSGKGRDRRRSRLR